MAKREQQIPFGDDNQKCNDKCNGNNDKCNGNGKFNGYDNGKYNGDLLHFVAKL